jgi:hypothetical protein
VDYDEALTRARRGAALLDQHGPSAWRDKINVETLDISKPSRCPLGQVYGSYSSGINAIRAQVYGYVDSFATGFDCNGDYASVLKMAWTQVINEGRPVRLDMNAFIDEHATELERIYEAQTAGSFTFHGFMYKMLKDLESKGVQLP